MTERTLLTNGRVLTCSTGPDEALLDADVLIEGDKIAKVSPGRLEIDPASARVIDLDGAVVLPGLGDAHVHISWPLHFEFNHGAVFATPPGEHMLDVAAVVRTFLESGYTLLIGGGVTQEYDDTLSRDFIDRGYIPGPHIVASGPMIADAHGLGGEGHMMEVASDAKSLREIVKSQCDRGFTALKIFISGDGITGDYPSQDTYMNDEMLTAAVDEADKHRAFITVHARSAESVAMAARTGVRIIHHATFLSDDAIREVEARGQDVFVCPGLHYLWSMVSGKAEPWGMTEERIVRSGYRDEYNSQVDGLKAFVAAGVPILSGGDFGHQWTHHGTYAAELQRYVELGGMSPVQAIHTATRNVGRAAGRNSGQIGEGYFADLFIVDGDPTADITVLQRPEARRAVIKDGEVAWVNTMMYP